MLQQLDLAVVLSATVIVIGLRISKSSSSSHKQPQQVPPAYKSDSLTEVIRKISSRTSSTTASSSCDTMETKSSDEAEQKLADAPGGVVTAQATPPEKAMLERTLLDSFAVQSIKIGDQLGLYVALYEAQSINELGYASLQEICDRAKTDARLTYEWLQFQVRVNYISFMSSTDGQERFRLEDSMAQYLLPPAFSSVSMVGAFRLSTCMLNLAPVLKSFETGQQSLFLGDEPADVKFEEDLSNAKTVENRIRYARETYSTRFFRYSLVDDVLMHIQGGPEIVQRLDAGEIDVAEVFCGATSGLLSIALATRFRAARFIGFESSHVSLTRARDLAHAAETKNARFYDIRERPVGFGPPPSISKKRVVRPGYGMVLTFMSLSMIEAEAQIAMFKDVRSGLDAGAPWIIMNLDAEQNQLSQAICLGMSMLHFLPSLPAPETCCAFTETRCRQLAQLAGFSSVEKGPQVTNDLLVPLNVFVLRV